ncbi:MAG: outer membrane beta-barrel protein [Bacteroidetes bacterium]|nr:outer membrane beta-barrel protein [Bacteroidota bacterium]
MSKKSFNDIEQAIKAAAEAHEPAFDEQAWKKMEALLDNDKDRKRPFAFWLWWLLPLLLVSGTLSYFAFKSPAKYNEPQKTSEQKKSAKMPNAVVQDMHAETGSIKSSTAGNTNTSNDTSLVEKQNINNQPNNLPNNKNIIISKQEPSKANTGTAEQESENLFTKNSNNKKTKGKMKVGIVAPAAANVNETTEPGDNSAKADADKKMATDTKDDNKKTEELVVINMDTAKMTEKKLQEIADSVVKKIKDDKKTKDKIVRLYVIAFGGAENSGAKLFSSGKITGRYGLEAGYRLNKKLSVQAGFYVSNKKYIATGSDYKTKPGTYWNTVDIKSIDAACRIYEIPLSVIYDFASGKKLKYFASAGLSSYIMKKEDYKFYYDHYGSMRQTDVKYTGNKNLFSVLRVSAGVEKKLSKNFSIIAAPGISIPLAGVGEGEVKLYSADIMIGIKFTPSRKK